MRLFSEREGLIEVRDAIQKESMDYKLRTAIWNVLFENFFLRINNDLAGPSLGDKVLVVNLWRNLFKEPLDERPKSGRNIVKYVKRYFFESSWNEVYDFVEFFIYSYQYSDKEDLISELNAALEKEGSAYRLMENRITELSSEEEINEIEEALSESPRPVEVHLQTSLEYLSDRESPDYRNSIKEAISAVESLCRIITGDNNATLGQALNRIEREGNIQIHGALKRAFSNLYGYTSAEGGIRHALLDESNLGYEDAKFMLVSCSAFINYLLAKNENQTCR